jgi:glycosyltransferase involved in cell wall biosynthesis
MKILLYAIDFTPSIGGIQTITEVLAAGLAGWNGGSNGNGGQKNQVTVVTQTPAGHIDDAQFSFRVVRRPGTAELFGLVRDTDIFHIVGPAIVPMAMGLLLGKPVAVQHCGYMAICPIGNYLHQPGGTLCPGHFQSGNYLECYRCQRVEMSRARSIRNLLLMMPRRWLLKRVAANIGVSDHTGRRVALPRTQTIYHGIEDPLASGAAQAAPIPRGDSPIQFAYVGRLVTEKGVDVLLEAAAKLSKAGTDFRLKIIGDGPDRQRLESLSRELGVGAGVHFLGYRSGESLAAALQGVSVNIMPSRCEEACPLTAIEQMMRGQLMIAADLGGLGEVVGDTGLKFAPGDSDGLAECIRQVILQPALIQTLGEAGRRRALQIFSKEEMMQQHLALYGQVAHSHGAVRD